MNRSRDPDPRTLRSPCWRSSPSSPRPAADATTSSPAPAASAGRPERPPPRRPRRRSPVAVTPEPIAGRARPERRQRRPLVHRPRQRARSPRRSPPSRRSSRPSTPPRRMSTCRSRSSTTPMAASTLQTQIAAGNPPDIIGPVGVEGLNLFVDQLLDLAPLIASDRLRHDRARPGAGRLLQDRRQSGATIGLPVRDLSVVHLLQQGALRRGRSCPIRRPRSATCTKASRGTWKPFASWRMKLTVDKNGNDATEPRLRPRRTSSSGASTSSTRTTAPPSRDRPLRRRLAGRRRRQDRPDPEYIADGREVVQRRRLEGPLHPERQPGRRATCSTRAASSRRATWP